MYLIFLYDFSFLKKCVVKKFMKDNPVGRTKFILYLHEQAPNDRFAIPKSDTDRNFDSSLNSPSPRMRLIRSPVKTRIMTSASSLSLPSLHGRSY